MEEDERKREKTDACGSKRKATAGLWTMRSLSDAPKVTSSKRKAEEWISSRSKSFASEKKLFALEDKERREG